VVPTRHRLPLAHGAFRAGGRVAAVCVARRCVPTAVATRSALRHPTSHSIPFVAPAAHAASRQPSHSAHRHMCSRTHRPTRFMLASVSPSLPTRCYRRAHPLRAGAIGIRHTLRSTTAALACPCRSAHSLRCCRPASRAVYLHALHQVAANCTAVMGWEVWGGGGGETGGCMCALHNDATPGSAHARCCSGRTATRLPMTPPHRRRLGRRHAAASAPAMMRRHHSHSLASPLRVHVQLSAPTSRVSAAA
jgi:hypothetical protein